MPTNVESFYDSYAHNEWTRFDRHRTEFAVTKRALAEFLPPSGSVLDCGGGPGRYAIHLARLGYAVTLLDLSAGNLALARQKAAEAGVSLYEVLQGNALDLSRFPDAGFDAVLLMGPLYHLIRPADRERAVREALRVLKPGGMLFCAFITLYAPLRDAIAKGNLKNFSSDPALTENLLRQQFLEQLEGFTEAWFALPAEVRPWMETFPLRTRALLGVEGLAAGHEQHINALEDEHFEYWADLNYRVCADPHLYGASDHLLYAGEKIG